MEGSSAQTAQSLTDANPIESESSYPSGASSHEDEEDCSLFMCLKCRKTGHVFYRCADDWPAERWITSQARKKMTFDDSPDDELCQRCQGLDIVNFMHQELPCDSLEHLKGSIIRNSGCFRSLGKVRTTIFRQDCSLCRCLFTLLPLDEYMHKVWEDEIMLLPSWTICRLEGEISMNTPETANYARCLIITLGLPSRNFAYYAQSGESLCLLEEDLLDPDTGLGARLVDQVELDYGIIEKWISLCERLHPITCSPTRHEELRTIKVIDVHSRQVIKYPAGCDYLALSYVWGEIKQASHVCGSVLEALPQTIEDAITFTRKLGRKYLWVDSICIEQDNEVEKKQQIGIMGLIYEGAYATIVALSGTSATSGLPRVSTSNTIIPQMNTYIDGRRLVGLGPTLSHLILTSPWGKRGWTMQEAVLSHRCIYFSSDQVLLECNSMQCSECLDNSKSWVHSTCRDEAYIRLQSDESIGSGVLRSPFISANQCDTRLLKYNSLTDIYSRRDLTSEDDAINGFSGILQVMTGVGYRQGFYWGLPKEDLNWALGWVSSALSDTPAVRRINFPTWSWAGWRTRVLGLKPFGAIEPNEIPIYIKIWQLLNGRFDMLLNLPATESLQAKLVKKASRLQHFTSLTAASELPEFDYDTIPDTLRAKCLFIEGLVCNFMPSFEKRLEYVGYGTRFHMRVGSKYCVVQFIRDDTILFVKKRLRCLLLAKDRHSVWDINHMLVLSSDEHLVERVTRITIRMPVEHGDLLDHADFRLEKIILK